MIRLASIPAAGEPQGSPEEAKGVKEVAKEAKEAKEGNQAMNTHVSLCLAQLA